MNLLNPVNIIDVRKHREATDPQGRVHKIPKGPSVGTNTQKSTSCPSSFKPLVKYSA